MKKDKIKRLRIRLMASVISGLFRRLAILPPTVECILKRSFACVSPKFKGSNKLSRFKAKGKYLQWLKIGLMFEYSKGNRYHTKQVSCHF